MVPAAAAAVATAGTGMAAAAATAAPVTAAAMSATSQGIHAGQRQNANQRSKFNSLPHASAFYLSVSCGALICKAAFWNTDGRSVCASRADAEGKRAKSSLRFTLRSVGEFGFITLVQPPSAIRWAFQDGDRVRGKQTKLSTNETQ